MIIKAPFTLSDTLLGPEPKWYDWLLHPIKTWKRRKKKSNIIDDTATVLAEEIRKEIDKELLEELKRKMK